MKKISIFLINLYKKFFSNELAKRGCNCKFYPTCSDYMKQAIEKYGFLKGFLKGVFRLLRCNPFSKGGYDPLK